MAPNSLIFLIIIGIWAAYLGKYWLRRRDHLATARSMDSFSESIRVLGQGRAAPTTDVHRAPHRSYAVTPGGPMRPQVTVKRSVPSGSEEPTSAEPRSGRVVPRAARGILLLVALAAFVISLPVAVLWDRFPLWGSLVVLANAVAAFFFLRAAVQADIAAKQTSRPAPATAPRTRPAEAPEASVDKIEVEPVAEPAARSDEVFDDSTLAPAAPAAREPRREGGATDPVPVEADDDIPATWDPRPVPTPTYAMKQRAGHPVPPPAEVPVPEPIELEDDDEVSFERRASGA